MLNFVRLFCRLIASIALALLSFEATAQIFTGVPINIEPPAEVRQTLTEWKIYRLEAGEMKRYANGAPETGPMHLHIGAHHWKLQLQPSNLLAPNYALQVSTETGVEKYTHTDHRAFKGTELSGGGMVRLTLNDNFIHGFIESAGERYYIEPLWYHDRSAAADLFLVYPASAVIFDPTVTCLELAANESLPNVEETLKKDMEATPEFMACYELEMAIASDNSMFVKYGSVSAVEDHNIGVLNDVQGNYTGSFNHDINLVIVTQFVVTGTDPWTSSTNADNLLSSFTSWGNNGGFGVPFDNGELWTNRNFDGSTVGLAWLNGICNPYKYHCLQDFSTNAEFLRVLTAHELGHNFSASHDAPNSGFIMAPSVNTSTTWSSASTTSISNYITIKVNSGCLGPCGSSAPLVADFQWSPDEPCQGDPVQFTDMSSGNITSRSWAFSGGTPPTSTQTNPTVTWNSPGTYTVTLTLNGTGGPVSTSKTITILANPTANFTYTYDDLTYTFTSTSSNGNIYSWSFGDGGTSNDENPVYTYAEPGFYTVILTVENDCGTATKSSFINTVPVADFSASPTTGCTPMSVQFSNQSSFNATAFSWQFPGAVQQFSSIPNPITTYNTPGVYTVTLTVSNASGSSTMVKTNLITVLTTPTANFNFGINGQTVTFTNNSIGATSYLWNFGDGNTSTLNNPAHTYATGGVYTVTLVSTNVCGSDSSVQTISLLAPPTAGFTANTTSGCSPLTVNFTNTTTGSATSYSWSFPGGTPSSSTAQNPTVVYNSAGTYTVSLTATNAAGSNTSTQTNYITVQTAPVAGFTSSTSGLTATFTNTSSGATAYSWNFGDGGTSTVLNPVHNYAADGTYTVTLTVTNPCGTNTTTQSVVIITPPTAAFTATPTSGCGPLTVQFNNMSSANATSFSWSFPGGTPASSVAQNPVVTYSTAGTYSVTLTATNAAGSNSSTQTGYITVNPNPVAGFTSVVNGSNASFTNTSTNAVSYAWNFGDGNSSTQQNPSHTYANDGTYTVTLTATNPCGVHTFTQTVVIATPPTAGFTAAPVSGCGPLTVQFTSTSSANSTGFNWSFPGGTPASSPVQNPVVVYNTPGTYSVTLTVSNATGSNTATQSNYVTVNAGPGAGFSSSVNGNTATFTNTSVNAVSYSWDFGDGNSSSLQNPSHVYANDGSYTVTLTATNPCGTNTFTQTVTIVTPPTAGFSATPTSGCGPLSVQFTSTSSANAVNFNWSFPGGLPSSSTAQNPVVSYDVPGTYTVTLTVSNAAGSNSTTQTNYVTVNGGPSAGFTSVTNGLTATFTNASANAVSYSWNFGDGNSSTQQDPSHTYANDGTYTVILTATNPCGTSTFSQTVVIITSPTAGFTANTTVGCGPLSVQFQDLSSGNTTGWSWTFPGGTPASSNLQNPLVVYNTPGVYSVTLIASTAAGTSTFTQPNFVTVLGPPATSFTASTTVGTVVFTNTSQNAVSYLWDFGDGSTSSVANPTHVYGADGTYTVTLTATNNCGSTTFSQTVTILLPPQAAFTPSVATGCAPLTVHFTNQSSASATSYSWTFAGGTPATSSEAEPTVIFNQPGVYTVTLVASNASGSNTSTTLITVSGLPTAGFTMQTAGLSVVLTNTSANATSYLWNFGDGSTSTEVNPTHNYGNTGSYTVVLRAENACGITEISQTVEISGTAPIAAFTVNQTIGCIPLTVSYLDQSAGSPTAWSWTFPGGNPASSSLQNPTVTYATPGVYAVTLEVTNAFGTNSITKQDVVEVLAQPSAGFAFDANQTTVTFTNTSQNGSSYSWNFGDGNTSTETNPTHTYAAAGTYTVELTVANNCGASTLQQMITLTSGTQETAWLEQFRLFPNPNTGIFTVEMEGGSRPELEFVLFNVTGQPVDRRQAEFGTGKLKQNFDYSGLPGGMYTLQIRSGERFMQVKIVIQR